MKNIVTSKTVATVFAVTQQTVSNWTRSGKLPHWRTLGGRARYDLDQILELKKRFEASNLGEVTSRSCFSE